MVAQRRLRWRDETQMMSVKLGEAFVTGGFPRLVEGVADVVLARGWARAHSPKEKRHGKSEGIRAPARARLA